MNRSYVSGMLSGFFGGILGAGLLAHFNLGAVIPKVAAATQSQVISENRIRLLDSSGRGRAAGHVTRRRTRAVFL